MKRKIVGGGLLNKHNSLKLQKFKESNSKRKVIIAIILSVLLLSSVYLYSSFAVFSEEKKFNVINGTVSDPGDIYFAYYVDGVITRSMPSQNMGYKLDEGKSECTNGVTVSFNTTAWSAILNYQNYNATGYTRTRCNLYFIKTDYCSLHADTLACQIIKKASSSSELVLDNEESARYIGKDPNNYVKIGSNIWRIIGAFNNISDENNNQETRIKIIKNALIGSYSWDTSESSVNNGTGVNEWSQADLMKLLNPGYKSESIGGSLYWDRQSGTCYNGSENSVTSCDFTNDGFTDYEKKLISKVIWHTGSLPTDSESRLTDLIYGYERSKVSGKLCVSGNYCNDDLERKNNWTGFIALPYLSDYGYATSGGATTNRDKCLNVSLYYWDNNSYSDCKNNDWLFDESTYQWTLTPGANSTYASYVGYINNNGPGYIHEAYKAGSVRPTAYLLSTIVSISGDGTKNNPYILG